MDFIKKAGETLKFPKLKKVKRRIKSDNPEAILQRQCEAYLELQGLEFLHIPNSMWASLFQNKSFGALNECSDYLSGFPDLLIFDGNGRYLAIELKTAIGRESKKQKDKKRSLGGCVCRTFEEFKKLVDNFPETLIVPQLKLLQRHNRWRHGDDKIEMAGPKELGESIDAVLDFFKENHDRHINENCNKQNS